MKETRIMPSSPDYDEINELTTKIGMLKNPHMFKELEGVPDAERLAALSEHEEQLRELLEFQNLPFNKALK